ncbi:DNA mismatch repair endonuclease MutL [Parafilimonas sp.]|uniref:DNA mismatch repair endonuclease MutL n=1 Tax=Parafilimonas sp. TaxID=1969739 RepID=UPI0039E442A3
MIDIIYLLPDNIANQIAAGEVIQRPASAVKELLENAVDAGAASIEMHLADAGKTLIQVIDNGKGMSETDARMCFERHATSKIKNIDDLFHIRTMGFRGEALASIAAVAQVELKTRRAEDELGTFIEIDNSIVRKQEACACAIGTNISMKNLFFSVPARRNFLKSNASEMRHIVDEFIHVALAFPNIFFSLTNNGQQLFHLEPGNYKQRFLQLLGHQYNTKLVAVKETTDYLNINGFVGKPDAAKKTRGDQYFFVNNRFIKSAYLNHAVTTAFDALLPKDSFPVYALYIDLDPSQVDINVHPTKQEIKFEDEKIVYAFVQAAIKHALAQFSISPSLDFSLNADIMQAEAITQPFTQEKKETVTASELYKKFSQKNQAHLIEPGEKNVLRHWQDFYTEGNLSGDTLPIAANTLNLNNQQLPVVNSQLLNTYIAGSLQNGFMLIHQQHAHERILFERYSAIVQSRQPVTQQTLFPVTLELSPQDAALLTELLSDLELLGYKIEAFGRNSFIIQGTPADILQGNEKHSVELLLEQFKHFSSELKFGRRDRLIHCMARQQAIKAGRQLTMKEMETLVEDLFKCNTPSVTPNGNPVFVEFNDEQLLRMFGR